MRATSIMISSAHRNKDERFMACKKFKQQKNQTFLSVLFLTHDLQTLAHVENKVKTFFVGAKYEKHKYSYETENRDFYRKSQRDSPPAFNSNESKSVTCTLTRSHSLKL